MKAGQKKWFSVTLTFLLIASHAGLARAEAAASENFLAPIEAPAPGAIPIYNAQDLDNIRNDLRGSYVLMNDIDLAGWGAWTPIGSDAWTPMQGVFDGQGHVIRNLTITGETDLPYVGLFGRFNGGVLKNLGLEDTHLDAVFGDGAHALGGLCGSAYNAQIINCYHTGSVIASSVSGNSSLSAGGICGGEYATTIRDCYNTGAVSVSTKASSDGGYSYAGGIGGAINTGSISRCYNAGTVSDDSSFETRGKSYIGGICGNAEFLNISNCFNTGDVSSATSGNGGEPNAGGICGFSFYTEIQTCYNTGNISASLSSVFGFAYAGGICALLYSDSISRCVTLSSEVQALKNNTSADMRSYCIGYASSSGTKANNLALSDMAGNAIDDASARITEAEAGQQSTYENLGWDFSTVWEMADGYRYPRLMVQQGFRLAGKINSYSPQHPVNLQLLQGNETRYEIEVPAESGTGQTEQGFQFTGVIPGTYTLHITKPAHTSYTVNNITLTDQDIDLTQNGRKQIQLMTLPVGDIDGSGSINVSDLNIVWSRAIYNKQAAAAEKPLCDLNGDGFINVTDLNILWSRANYNKSGVTVEYNN
ncbi:MAG: dockerin type I domain-containing protein [Clostridiales bacterium]|nr:dockerin type I domain-containing protein [Clostridiales bacterium]